jgi:hypothetical protein
MLRPACCALLLCSFAFSQTQQQPPKQQPPTAADTQGYSKDLINAEPDAPSLKGTPIYTPAAKPQPVPADLEEIVKKQFGDSFQLFTEFETPLLTGDFDGDGIEDAAIVARSKHPLAQAALLNYRAFSPQNEYFGYGDPKISTAFSMEDWDKRKLILVIHGAGPQAWRAEQPKGKYLLIDVPFDHLTVMKTRIKKHKQDVISAEESAIMSSVLYWTGKKYKWEPNASAE